MMIARRYRLQRLLTAVLLMLAMLAALPHARAAQPPRQLQVQAEAELQVIPDRATLSARLWERTPAVAQRDVSANDPDALRDARIRLEARAAQLIQTLEAAGIARRAIHAGSLRVQPEQLPGDIRDDGPAETLVRTRLERPMRVDLDNLAQLPALLDALTEAGVDALEGVHYDLADRDAATDDALVRALNKARHKAELMARTLGVELGEVLAVSETRAPVFQPRQVAMSEASASASQAEYRPGTLAVEAGVSVSWALAP